MSQHATIGAAMSSPAFRGDLRKVYRAALRVPAPWDAEDAPWFHGMGAHAAAVLARCPERFKTGPAAQVPIPVTRTRTETAHAWPLACGHVLTTFAQTRGPSLRCPACGPGAR